MGVTLQSGQWAMRMNLVTLDERGTLTNACPDLDEAGVLARTRMLLTDSVFAGLLNRNGITLHPHASFRQMLTGGGTLPPCPVPPHNVTGSAMQSCIPCDGFYDVLMNAGRNALRHFGTANAVWPWGCGTAPEYQSFTGKYGLRGACVSAVPMVQGLARLCGMDAIYVPGATGTLHTNWRGKAAACVDAFRQNDFVLLHIEAPDDCSHALDVGGKVRAIEIIDAAVYAVLKAMGGAHLRVLLCSDHYTLAATGRHDPTPAPYCVWDSRDTGGIGGIFVEGQGTAVSADSPIKMLLRR
jgi:2,3-bisphosphoglycerate-independent phosphoglycerate mutase